MKLTLIFLVSLLSCAGQLCQKKASTGRRASAVLIWLALSLLLLGTGMLFWLGVLRQVPVSVAYPMLSLNFVLVTLAARFIWQEKVSRRHWLGIALIMAGVAVMGAFT